MTDETKPAPDAKYPNRIHHYRRLKKLSLQELAALAKLSFQTLQRWESKQPKLPLAKVTKLAEALDVKPRDLLPYANELDDEEAFLVGRYRAASESERRSILKSVRGLTDRDEEAFTPRREEPRGKRR